MTNLPPSCYLVALPTTQEPKTAPPGPAPAPSGPNGAGQVQQPGGAGGAGPGQACGDSTTMWMLLPFLLLMWLMVMRPEQKRRKEQQNLLASLKAGDRVVTIGGMHGVIASLTDKTVVLRVDAVQMTVDRTAIARVERDDAQKEQPRKG